MASQGPVVRDAFCRLLQNCRSCRVLDGNCELGSGVHPKLNVVFMVAFRETLSALRLCAEFGVYVLGECPLIRFDS